MLMRGPMRAHRGPGLLGAAARTAVVAGTATAVTGGMRRRQADRAAEQDAAARYQAGQQAEQAQMYAAQAAQAQTAPADPAPDAGGSAVDQLERLARLRDQGVLTDAGFAAQKAKILGT